MASFHSKGVAKHLHAQQILTTKHYYYSNAEALQACWRAHTFFLKHVKRFYFMYDVHNGDLLPYGDFHGVHQF